MVGFRNTAIHEYQAVDLRIVEAVITRGLDDLLASDREKNAARCNCTYPGCPRHGICCECLAYHRATDELPACCFTAAQERTYDRSIRYFLSCQRS